MLRICFNLLLLLGISECLFAQRAGGLAKELIAERIKQFRRSYITEAIALPSKDSARFWEIYERYDDKLVSLRKQQRKLFKSSLAKSDEQLKADLQKFYALQDEEIAVGRKMIEELQKVITIRQIIALFAAEKEMKRRIVQRMAEERMEQEDD